MKNSFSQEVFIRDDSHTNLYYVSNSKSNSLTLDKPANSNAVVAIQGTTDYQAYGVHSDTLKTNVATNFSYNGEYQDSSSGLVYLRARDYDEGTQRFITQDNTNVWNKYNFANSNPIMNIDPSGHMPAWLNYTLNGLGIAGAIGAIIAGVASGGAALPLIAAVLGGASGATGVVAEAAGNDSGWQTASLVLGIASMGFDVASFATTPVAAVAETPAVPGVEIPAVAGAEEGVIQFNTPDTIAQELQRNEVVIIATRASQDGTYKHHAAFDVVTITDRANMSINVIRYHVADIRNLTEYKAVTNYTHDFLSNKPVGIGSTIRKINSVEDLNSSYVRYFNSNFSFYIVRRPVGEFKRVFNLVQSDYLSQNRPFYAEVIQDGFNPSTDVCSCNTFVDDILERLR
ncbi:RHS repeat-associated core domain-containing protein [Cysteiniphilum sp. JM-1]|uniref:RHS repeat-associated core domain-containing protein n=1 Tax=Cysteiniphilum sp. JM-1 TaxID=2610891 RepID=UPI00168CB9D5|nr:RHS repeat-associated core domain-containing protein [Cysteiniphilum sp. JM-1]